MKRLNWAAGAVLAATGLASSGAFAAPTWGPSGEANYEEHQAQPVSQYTRAQVHEAYLQAAAAGALPRTAEAVAESPAELALAVAPMEMTPPTALAPLEPAVPVAAAQPEQTPSYAYPANADVLAASLPSRAGDLPLPLPGSPQPPLQASPDMMANDEELALSEGEELVASEGDAGTQSLQ